MRFRLLRLAEGRILVEQVRLLCQHVATSIIPTFLLLGIIFWVMSDGKDVEGRWQLGIWCLVTAMTKLGCRIHAHRQLARGIHSDNASRLVLVLMAIQLFNGLVWGALLWVALDPTHLAGSLFVLAIFSGVAAQAMSLLSPVVPVFVAFAVGISLASASRLLMLGDPIYAALGVGGCLYIVIMFGQAVNNARTARTSIELRFENVDLLEKLRRETAVAESARRDAEEANLAKSKFLAAASHDLRQPIHAQGLFLDVLRRTALTPHQAEVLASARSASLASSEMLNTLLDFSRIEAGVVQPFIQPFALQPLLHKIENDLAPLADAKGLVYRSLESHRVIASDASLVEMILRNLVSNAIRYTDHGGVLVACRPRAGQLAIEVWDTGIGIAEHNQAEIFREFHQLGNAERDRRKGLGLGLSIADGLAKALGLTLSLSSRPGRGTVFRLLLPLGDAVAADVPVHRAPLPGLLHGVHVLVIDDDDVVRAGMAQLMDSWGCEVDTAHSISVALALAELLPPDVVVSDYRLRGQRTGAQAIDAVRQLLGTPVPALIVTGDTAPERLREALASGIPLLHKPVAPGALYQALVDVLPDARLTAIDARAPAPRAGEAA